MITSQQEYETTKRKKAMLEESLAAPGRAGVPVEVVEAARAQTRDLIGEMQAEIEEYERTIRSAPNEIPVNSVDDLLVAPIRYRLAAHMSTESFARTVGVSARQIFRYEQEGYRNCSVPNLAKILESLNICLRGRIEMQK